MVVRAYDTSHRMMRTRKQRTFIKQTSPRTSSRKVAGEHGIRAERDRERRPATSTSCSTTRPTGSSCWRLAQADRLRVRRRRQARPTFKPPDADATRSSSRYPDDLRAFRPRITAVQQVEKVNVRGFDLKAKQTVARTQVQRRSRSPRPGSRASTMVDASSRARSSRSPASRSAPAARPTTMAQATLDQLANAYLAAEGACHGDPRIKAGVKLKITGVGRSTRAPTAWPRPSTRISGGGGYETAFSNSAGEHTPARAVRRRQRAAPASRSTRSWSAS